jgi:hypothetical protein
MSKILVVVAVVSAPTFTTRLAAADEIVPEIVPVFKDRSTAFALSAGGTAVSIGLVLVGAKTGNWRLTGVGLLSSLVAPSAGEMYTGKIFTAGTGIRLGSVGFGLVGLAAAATSFVQSAASGNGGNGSGPGPVIVLAGLGYATGIIYDIATAGRAVDDYNQHPRRFRVIPTVIPTPSSNPAVGLGIGGSF